MLSRFYLVFYDFLGVCKLIFWWYFLVSFKLSRDDDRFIIFKVIFFLVLIFFKVGKRNILIKYCF